MNTTLRIGDLLYRQKGFVEHAGVYLGNERVLHNSPSNDVEVITLADYSNGLPIKVIWTEYVDISLLTNRLRSILATNNNYQPFLNNCEHIATFMLHGRKWSPQVQATMIGSAIGAMIGNKMRKTGWLFGLLIGGLTGCVVNNYLREYDITLKPM